MANDPLQPMFKRVSIKYEQTALQLEFKDLLLPDSYTMNMSTLSELKTFLSSISKHKGPRSLPPMSITAGGSRKGQSKIK